MVSTQNKYSEHQIDKINWEYEKKLLLNMLKNNEEIISNTIKVLADEIQMSIDEFKDNLQGMVSGVVEISNAANELVLIVENQKVIITGLVDDQAKLDNQSYNVFDQIEELNVQIKELFSISFNINNLLFNNQEISEKLNIISINGSIQAARAGGSFGRSFKVVSENIRSLATDSSKIIKNQSASISNIIENIKKSHKNSNEIVHLIHKNKDTLENTTNLIKKLDDEMLNIASNTEQLSSTVTQFSASLEELHAAINSISTNINNFHDFLKNEFTLTNKAAMLSTKILEITKNSMSLSEAASIIVRYLYNEFKENNDVSQFAMVRIFLTLPFEYLPAEYKEEVSFIANRENHKYLCLIGTSGIESAWNQVNKSVNHKMIKLPGNQEDLRLMPMFAEMFNSMKIPYKDIINSDENKSKYDFIEGYMLVKEAAGSEYIPVQDDFVRKYNIKSELGMGGYLPSGSIFTCFIFSKQELSKSFAEKMKTLPVALKQAFLKFDMKHQYW